jgi:DNA-binding transcriptional MerR regulator
MALKTISQVAKHYDLSTRTLRYYEEIGLLPSRREEDYAYRLYDEKALQRLNHIVVLRKLRIPLKQIGEVLDQKDICAALQTFEDNIRLMDKEISALMTIRDFLSVLVKRINENLTLRVSTEILGDNFLFEIIETLSDQDQITDEENSMEALEKSNETLSTLKDVRIIHLPPLVVASSHYFGKNPEDNAMAMLNDFIRTTGLADIKSDLRIFGFNNPSEQDEDGNYGYEFWVTIPVDLQVTAPIVRKSFDGGLYGAHAIQMGNFHEWQWLYEWVKASEKYELDSREPLGMGGSLEEHLNPYAYYMLMEPDQAKFDQLDLLIPIVSK